MEVDGELDSKKKLDQGKREIVKQLRKIDDFTDLPQDFVVNRAMHCRTLSKSETTSYREYQQMQNLSQKLQSLQDKKQQSQRTVDRWTKRNEQLRITIEKTASRNGRPLPNNPSEIVGQGTIGHGNQRPASRRRKKR